MSMCSWAGHKWNAKGVVYGLKYGELRFAGTDGMGVTHADVIVRCERCGKGYPLCKIHLPKNGILT